MRRTADSDGYVTLVVLLVVGLLAAIASSLLAVARPALGLARIGSDQVAADALVDGGLTTAAFVLFGEKKETAALNGRVLRLKTGDIRLTVADEGGRVDLNGADSSLLAGLYAAVGGESMSAQAFGNRIVDWRDEDTDLNEDGAEAAGYTDAGLPYGPSNLPFHSVEEARLILGLSSRDFDRLAPYLTVYTGSAKVDPVSAPERVLRAIPGAGRRELQQILQARRAGRDRARLIELVPGIAEFLMAESSSVYRVGVRVELKDGFSEAAEAVIIAPQADGSAGYRVVAWSKPAAAPRTQ